MLQFQLLGGLYICREGVELKGFISRKAQALLVYLALTRRVHFRETLQGLLWGDVSQARAAGNLRVVLNNLRHLVPNQLEVNRSQVVFRLEETCRLDVVDFEQHASQTDISHLQAAADLYRGDLLDGFFLADSQAFDEWLLAERERLRQMIMQTLHAIADYQTRRGNYRAGMDAVSRLLALDAWREEAHREMMRLLALTGQRSAALAQYEKCRRLLAQELDLEPLEETTTLYQQIKTGAFKIGEVNEYPGSASSELPFTGREQEHAQLLGWWQEAQRGAGCLCLVEGEGGIGKTRLINEVIRYIGTQGAQVLNGRCYEFGGSVPYQPIAEALCPLRLQLDKASSWSAELFYLPPELRQENPTLPDMTRADHETARLRLFEAVVRLVKDLSRRRTVVLFLDDLQWADSSTLDLLHYLVRQLHRTPLWVIGAYRPEEVGLSHPLTRLRQGLGRDHLTHCLSLAPLKPEAVFEIITTLFGSQTQELGLSEFLHCESEGSPFVLAETIASLQEQGMLSCQSGLWRWAGPPADGLLPPSVQDLIMQRIGRLSEAAQRLLNVAAVAGRQFDQALLRLAAGVDAIQVDECLDQWLERRLVRAVAKGPSKVGYNFSHDKIRAAVYGALPVARRQNLHARIGEVLENLHQAQLASVYEILTYHFEHAGMVDKALLYLPLAAAKAAAAYANEQALDYYQRALALCPCSDERIWPIFLAQADVLSLQGKYDDAFATCQQVAAGASPFWQARAYRSLAQISHVRREYEAARRFAGQSEQVARLVIHQPGGESLHAQVLQVQGEIEREQSHLARAQEFFEAALAVYERIEDASGLANCFKGLGDILSARSCYSQARQRYEQALGRFQKLGNQHLAGACWQGIAKAAWRQQDYTASCQAASASLEICRAIGDRQGEASALNSLGLCAIIHRDHLEAQQCWNASVAIYRELGLEKRAAPGLHNLGICYMDCGNLPAAQSCLEQALEINRSAVIRRDQALDLGWLGKLHWLLRDYATADTFLEKALALDEEIGGGEEQDWHLVWRAAVACESGDLPKAWLYLQQAERLLPRCANLKHWDILQWRANIQLAEGQVKAALQAAEQALDEAQSGEADASTRGAILTLLGRIHHRLPLSESLEAIHLFEQALVQLPDAAPTIYTRASTLHYYSAFLAEHGQTDRARACQKEAQAIFARIGVPP